MGEEFKAALNMGENLSIFPPKCVKRGPTIFCVYWGTATPFQNFTSGDIIGGAPLKRGFV